MESLGDFDAAGFADDGDADLAGVLEFVFDFCSDVAGEGVGLIIIDMVRLDEDAKFAARLDGEGFFDARKAGGDFFEVFDTLEVGGHAF